MLPIDGCLISLNLNKAQIKFKLMRKKGLLMLEWRIASITILVES